ncbi:autotransporter outer membrane beta-barrel domain-containing protein [Pseudomonas fluorescens]|uniref:Autotransporter outer membrane beta-barrel domain-containing protein n=1 Tax=Pseudomonas lactucae TaxID=2813360 RepID=A0A9X0YB44_9PSED|nr:autotransporter outer membrane beta-barrel domain-containing protein [Pseudomonas lactucae]OPA91503.1 autotransporter outer membrane beta-barrel domain-containing protein [Pseudomonas fluorescens]MBN2976923.1 autotransporter outer membrane beta-barrel domain-containing protein [Pseudomonas lactucae]MBN2988787.1 autotransporter outer membrane beta-barrel domain-containing protein [Pseudomonas lactucae]OPB10425.1 autotransporter outer membrane beta-barrel domain-containing protein [Pseudomonas
MSINARFKKHPLALALQVPAVGFLMLGATFSHATTTLHPGMERTIESGARIDDWFIGQGAHLTANAAQLRQSRVTAGTLTLNAGTKAQDIYASQGAQIYLNNATVEARGSAGVAINLVGSQALIRGSTVINNNGVGLSAARNFLSEDGSTAAVFDSVIQGSTTGARATAFSELNFYGSDVIATDEDGVGVLLYGGSANAVGSTITGGENGVRLSYESADFNSSTLVLDGSHVEGRNGAALLVEGDAYGTTNADIQVVNGSTLKGGNGNLLEVTGGSFANMNVDGSTLFGDVVVEEGSTAKLQLHNGSWLTGQLKNVAELSVNNASHWALVGDSEVGDLKMAGGSVHFGGPNEFYRLDVDSLSGDGTFVMHTDFGSGQTDLLAVNGIAEGNHSLLLAATGSELATAEPIRVVSTEGGDAQFALVGGTVDAGAYSYGLKQEDTDWYLDPNRRGTSNSTKAVMALFNTSPTVLYGEMTLLRTRMGELRFSQGNNEGFWMRGYGNKYEVSGNQDGGGYTQNQRGFTLGVDTPLYGGDGQWVAGVMAGHSTSDIDLNRSGGGTVDSYYVGGYATWLDDESGLYFDGVVKLNRLHNEVNVSMSDGKKAKGNYTQNAVGASVEVGRHIKLDDGYFVEPYGQLNAAITQAQSYDLDNGLHAKGDRSASVVGKAGVTVGKSIQLDSGGVLQPYLRTALAHEFNHNNKVTVNGERFNNDVFGSRIEMAGGVAMSVSQNVKLHADLEHTRGKTVDQPWGVNFGVRYDF